MGISSVGIVGLGVMGGSLARALSARGVEVKGFSLVPGDGRAARAAGAVGAVCPGVPATAVDVDWWIVATPLAALPEVFRAGAPAGPPRVMDLASVQGPALEAARAQGLAHVHCSAHPLAGSERSGFGASDATLYRGVTVWLSRPPEASASLADDAEAFWEALDARPRWVDAEEHDHRMAAASHLPQVTANVLAELMEARGLHPSDLGPGGLDMTRLAASSPEMWQDLLGASAPRVVPLLRDLSSRLDEWASRLEADDLRSVARGMARTRAWRRS